ncbi:MAG: PAS domain-containing sensor histidine kinase, partial [Segetibacter sp.]
MTVTANIEEHERLYLKDYANFVVKNKLEDFVSVYLINIYSFQIPLLQFFSHLSHQQLLASARNTITNLLRGIESGSAIEDVEKDLIRWKDNSLPSIPRESVSLKDITLIYSAQKISFQSFIPYYTSDVSVASRVIYEIELFYKQVQEMGLQMLDLIRKEDYEKRFESEDKYRSLFDNATDLIHIADREGHILYVNNAWSSTLGYKLDELKGKYIFDFIAREETENFKKQRQKIIDEKQTSVNLRTGFIKKNGEEITVEGSISYRYNKDNSDYTAALLHDVTSKLYQEKQIQFYIDQLADREKNLRDIIENAPDGVIVIDKESSIILWNPKSEEIFGWKKEEATGRKITEIIVPPGLRQAHQDGMKRFLFTKEATILNKTIQVPAIHKNGNEFYISLTVSHSPQNGKDLFIAFLRDITDQKKNELELENKRKQLEKSNQELEQYAWLTSHDLKEPLRKILTFSDALMKKDDGNFITQQSDNYIKKIHASAGRMKSLIEAVLSYSNVVSEQDLFVHTNLNDVINGVIEDLEISITIKKATIERENLPVVEAIPVQMTQLFQNIISNSLKYSKPHVPPTIKISCQKEKEGFTIFIKDNGIGFEEIYADKIFHVFQRLHSKSYEGTGIGLALCKKIADTHRG